MYNLSMCPERARIFVIDDDEFYQGRIRAILEGAGHEVVLTAETFEEAADLIRGGELSRLRIQVATIDGSIGPAAIGREGDLIAEFIREREPDIKTVGVSNLGNVANTDVNVHKFDLDRLGEIVRRL